MKLYAVTVTGSLKIGNHHLFAPREHVVAKIREAGPNPVFVPAVYTDKKKAQKKCDRLNDKFPAYGYKVITFSSLDADPND